MKTTIIPRPHRQMLAVTAASVASLVSAGPAPDAGPTKHIVLVAGARKSHGYDNHSYQAGCRLMAKWLKAGVPGLSIDVCIGWPKEDTVLDQADAVVVYCDGLGSHEINGREAKVKELVDKGVGLGFMHYGVCVPAGKQGALMLEAMGGYYETNWSVNPSWTAHFAKFPDHPAARGVKPFRIWDEWYYHMRFQDDMKGVTGLLTDLPPKQTLKRADGPHSNNPNVRAAVLERAEPQHVAWVYERPNGGRGFGFTGGHRFWNFAHDDFRKLVLNAVAWLAKVEIPADGIETATPTLDQLVEALGPPPAKWNRAGTEKLLGTFRAAASE